VEREEGKREETRGGDKDSLSVYVKIFQGTYAYFNILIGYFQSGSTTARCMCDLYPHSAVYSI
jgi:hypothetical protein